MRERKGTEFINAESIKSGTKEKKAPRARNRTVMLNAQETQSVRDKLKRNLSVEDQDDGFISPKKLVEKANQIEETYSESDVFITDDEEASNAELENAVQLQEKYEDFEDSDFVAPVEASYQEQQSSKIVLEEPAEFEESSELIETIKEEPVIIQKSLNINDKLSVIYSNPNSLIGFLVLVDEDNQGYSKYIELQKGRLIVTSIAPKGGDFILINDESVSPMHAVLRVGDKNSIQILDQLSEEGTKVVKASSGEIQELLGDKSTLEHGDVVSFGKCSLKVCLIG